MTNDKCIIDNKKSKKLIQLTDGNAICENHARLTPWQKEELIEKDANQVSEYIDKVDDHFLKQLGLEVADSSYRSMLHRAVESDLIDNASPEEILKLQNWILIKQNNDIIKLLQTLKSINQSIFYTHSLYRVCIFNFYPI